MLTQIAYLQSVCNNVLTDYYNLPANIFFSTIYLGVMIHSSMKTTIDVTRQTKKFYMQANLLLRNF